MSARLHAAGSPRHIVIGGGSGFIGSALSKALCARGDTVTLISRTPGPDRITWDDLASNGLPACDAVVNLAGQHILDVSRRWDDAYRNEVINSRVDTTRKLVRALNDSPQSARGVRLHRRQVLLRHARAG